MSSNPVSWITSLPTVYSILISQPTANSTPLKTALLYIHDYLISAIGSQKISCLCLLDLAAAFDTIDHDILIKRLHRRRLHRGNRELCPGTHARTGANVAFCPCAFHVDSRCVQYVEIRCALCTLQQSAAFTTFHRRRLHRGNRELCPGTHARTGANVAFCTGTFHGCALIF